jgi:hypothetical protein
MEIYLINQELRKAFEMEDEEQKEYLLSQLQLNLEERAGELLEVCKNNELYNDAIDAEIARLEALKTARSKKVALIKELIKQAMQKAQLKSIELPKFKLTIAKTPPRVVIENEALVPADYWKTIETHCISKSAILEDLKKGASIAGAKLEQDTRLRIK